MQELLPPRAVGLLKLEIKEEGCERMVLAVVAIQPRCARGGIQPEREVDREMTVNPLRLQGGDRLLELRDLLRLEFAGLIVVAVVNASRSAPRF